MRCSEVRGATPRVVFGELFRDVAPDADRGDDRPFQKPDNTEADQSTQPEQPLGIDQPTQRQLGQCGRGGGVRRRVAGWGRGVSVRTGGVPRRVERGVAGMGVGVAALDPGPGRVTGHTGRSPDVSHTIRGSVQADRPMVANRDQRTGAAPDGELRRRNSRHPADRPLYGAGGSASGRSPGPSPLSTGWSANLPGYPVSLAAAPASAVATTSP